MRWGGLVALALGGGALALALQRLRSKSSRDTASEREFGNVYYEVSGPENATAVVFTHGFALNHETWREQTATLSESYRVLSWDVPGCGDSAGSSVPVRFNVSARKLTDVLDEEGIDQAVLVGQSMGSLINQYVACHHPDRVRALVHVGGVPLHEGFSERMIKLMQWHPMILKAIPEQLLYDACGRLFAHTPDAQEYARRTTARTGKENMVSLEREYLKDLEEGVPELTEHPQLLVVGEHEYSTLRKKAKEWNDRLPDSVYTTVPDAGHIANHDNPTAFNEILSSFLESLD